jgi:selenocysteine lyase/cysteine desulfurase
MSLPLYFDHAATRWPKADGVADAMAAATRDVVGNAGRSSDDSGATIIERCRAELARLIGVSDPARVVLTHGCTDALNLAIFGMLGHRRDTPHVVSTVLEHNSTRRPLRHLQRRGAITLTEVGCDSDGFIDPRAVGAACRPGTALVACTHASNVVGTIQPFSEISAAVRTSAPSAGLLLDAAQTIGVINVNPVAIGADLLAFGTHKAIGGPAGLGVLYVGPRAFDSADPAHAMLQPVAFGGTGESGPAAQDDLPLLLPGRFEAGTRNPAIAAGVLAAVKALPCDGAAILHERQLLRRLVQGLRDLPVKIVGSDDMDRRVGVIAMQTLTMSAEELAAVLHASFSIVVRAGVQCAPAAHEALGTANGGTVRISVGPTTTSDEVDKLIAAVTQIVGDQVEQ